MNSPVSLSTITGQHGQARAPIPSPDSEAEAVAGRIDSHPGMFALKRFGEHLRKRPLDAASLQVFFASTAEFFREVPGGILALALRLTDDWMPHERFGAVEKGAQILYSAVDEFGLHQLRRGVQASHHAFFLETAAAFGVARSALEDPAAITQAAREMAALTALFYRRRPIGESLGFHLASELTSDVEFTLCLEGLRAHAEDYGLSGPDDPKLGFYLIHTQVEPMHGSSSRTAVRDYLARRPDCVDDIVAGADAFMDGYGRFFATLTERLSVPTLQRVA
ncbi:iron-containing redox enzyme family protein [Dongia sedimenti]|uniref:Iron-containing redox enzyme family protein n=1 Tax=Dongia sedimenti TaxID=3064282 RepID=A0ABU0YJ53_9PROT|nr:iron-containing redox enzyme family protein [Rhodospirillaceae bacterium R-7]